MVARESESETRVFAFPIPITTKIHLTKISKTKIRIGNRWVWLLGLESENMQSRLDGLKKHCRCSSTQRVHSQHSNDSFTMAKKDYYFWPFKIHSRIILDFRYPSLTYKKLVEKWRVFHCFQATGGYLSSATQHGRSHRVRNIDNGDVFRSFLSSTCLNDSEE